MKKSRKKLPLFWKIYIISFSVFALILAGLLIFGYNALVDYDETQNFPVKNANNYAKTLTNGSYGLICNDDRNAASVFENAEFSEIVKEKLAGSKITCEKGFSPDRYNKPIYTIKADGEAVANIEYKLKKETSSFGWDVYDFDHVSALIKGEYAIDFVIPSNASAFLNGVKVSEYWRKKDSKGNVLPDISSVEIYDPTTDLYGNNVSGSSTTFFTKYSVAGLFKTPELMVFDENGTAMNITYNSDLKAFCTIQDVIYILAPDDFKISVNGIEISNQDRFISEKNIAFEELSTVNQYLPREITLTKYIVTGVDPSSVNVVAQNYRGLQTPVYLDTEKGYYRAYNCMLENADKAVLLSEFGVSEERLINYAKFYAEFVANDNDRWKTIMPYVMPESEVYKTFDSFWSVLADHNSFWYEDVKVKDVSFYSDIAFSCRVSFVYWIKGFAGKPEATESYPTDITFYYVKKGNVWYISDWSLHSQTQG